MRTSKVHNCTVHCLDKYYCLLSSVLGNFAAVLETLPAWTIVTVFTVDDALLTVLECCAPARHKDRKLTTLKGAVTHFHRVQSAE